MRDFGTFDLQARAMRLTALLQIDPTFRTLLLLCSPLLLMPSAAAAQQTNASTNESLETVVHSMERAQSGIQMARHVTSEYHLGSPDSISSDSEVVAEVDFTSPGKYSIHRRSGGVRAEYIVKNVVQHEIEIANSAKKSQTTALNRRNYDFQYLGQAVLDGHACHLLRIIPRRQQSELIIGRAWIDKDSFLVRKIEGDLAKSPSWWVKNVHVDLSFASFEGVWIRTNTRAVADVRYFGAQELTSRVLNYTAAPSEAKNSKRWITPLSASVTAH